MLRNYYFERLNKEDKQVYSALLSGYAVRKDKIKVGTFPSAAVVEALNYEHPELYYVNLKVVQQLSVAYEKYIVPEYFYTVMECKQIEEYAKTIATNCITQDAEMTVRNLHNYLVKNVSYDESEIDVFAEYKRENHTMAGVFRDKQGVCEGIAKAFSYMLSVCNIDNVCVSGMLQNEQHLWNVVNIYGYNYHVDVTADIGGTRKKDKKPCYFYYLVTDAEIKVDHIFHERFNCYQTEANPFYANSRVFYSKQELNAFLSSVSRFKRTVYFKYLGNDMNENAMFNFVANILPISLISCKLEMRHNTANTIFYFYR